MALFPPHPERRAAIVTGASSGIGEATAHALAAAGHPVVLAARRVEVCEETAEKLRADGVDAVALPLDLTDDASIAAFAAAATEAMGPIEVLVNNAGNVLPEGGLDDPERFAVEVQVNLLGAQRLAHLVGRGMVERRRGDLVFVSSDVVRRPRPTMASYLAAKHGVEGLAKALQMELEGTGVRASIVSPGPTATGMGTYWDMDQLGPLMDQWTQWGLMRHPHCLPPEAIANAVLTVVSAPRGTHINMIEVEPEAPVAEPPAPADGGEEAT
jgi:NADP-dependent 3-hydroxy acid dehydrogenase YdfG